LRLTDIGRQAQRIPMHPRLARIVVAGDGSRAVTAACEFLADGRRLPPRSASTTSDLLAVVDSADRGLRPSTSSGRPERVEGRIAESDFRSAIFTGFPDRVAKRRAPGSPNVLLSSGTGAVMGRESGVVDAEFMVAIDVTNGVVRIASAVDREWLEPTSIDTVHRFDAASGSVRAALVKKYDAIVLSEHAATPDPSIAASLLAEAWLARGPGDAEQQLIRRLTFAGMEIDVAEAIRAAAHGARAIDDLTVAAALAPGVRRELDRLAPEAIEVPSGRRMRLEYGEDGGVSGSVKLQELFGLAETPRIGPHRQPVVLVLLGPNGRPVQVTRDLRGFWDRTYPEVRKELRGRYPKHAWPENPWKVKS
jgi:ATP-dependent helicase HrpB